MRVTVTGATGTIGLAAVQMLVRAGHDVRALVRQPDLFARRSREQRVEVVQGDILDRFAVSAATAGVDAVVHCVDFAPGEIERSWDAVRHALEGVPSGGYFVYPSNLWSYGPPARGRIGPDHPKAASSRLGTLRAELERAVTAQGGVVIHMPEVYGPGVWKGATQALLRRALTGRTVRVPGELDRLVELLYIEDAARALVAPLGRREARGREYTAPGITATTPRRFLSLAFEAAGHPPRLRALPRVWTRAADLFDRERRLLRELSYLRECPILLDGTRIGRELSWSPEVGYAEGVRRTVRWLREVERRAAADGVATS
jgi:nucleoside-diphosphate-sugar epimerase